MEPLATVDSDLYQHLLNVESKHNIAPQNSYIFGNYNLHLSRSNISISSLYSNSSNASNASSTASISSLSNSTLSDDDLSHSHLAQIPESYSIDGGLQRALVIMVPDPKRMNTLKNNCDGKAQTLLSFTDYSAAYDDRFTIDEECTVTAHANSNTFSFQSWMESYRNQPHRILTHKRRRVARRNQKKTHEKKTRNMANKAQLTHLDTLRHDLPYSPRKLRQLMRHIRSKYTHAHTPHAHAHSDSIEAIQQNIMALQNKLHDIRRMKRIKTQLDHWKQFKLNCGDWRLIDFYHYLSRIKGRKYAKYLVNFEVFYTQWMDIYDLDQKSLNQRFSSHIFGGKLLIHLDHDDLMTFGVNIKEDRREILMHIQSLNKHIK